MGNYITINDIDNWPAGLDDTQKEEIITRCEKLVEQVTRSFFYSKNFDIRLSGNNTQRLFFPYVQPIITVTAVYISSRANRMNSYLDKEELIADYFAYIAYLSDILVGDRVVFDSRIFEIRRIENPDQTSRYLKLYLREVF